MIDLIIHLNIYYTQKSKLFIKYSQFQLEMGILNEKLGLHL